MKNMENKHKTAVEWLIEEYYSNEGKLSRQEFEQAKAMEKEQTIAFADWIVDQKWDKVMIQGFNDDGTYRCKTTLEYYNETYEN